MKKGAIAFVLLLSFIFFCSTSFAGEKKQTVKRSEALDTTSKKLKEKYQSVNAAILATMISTSMYPGPFAGPGFYMGIDGPFVLIVWLKKNDKNKSEISSKRYIPIGSILSVDLPMHFKEAKNRYVVYYKGPYGETEFFILVDNKRENEKKSYYKSFINRWKSYLLSQELN